MTPRRARAVIIGVLLLLVAIVVVVGALSAIFGSEPVQSYLQNVAIVTAGLGFGVGGIRVSWHNGKDDSA